MYQNTDACGLLLNDFETVINLKPCTFHLKPIHVYEFHGTASINSKCDPVIDDDCNSVGREPGRDSLLGR